MLKLGGVRKGRPVLQLLVELKFGLKFDEKAKVYVSYVPAFDLYSQGTSQSRAIAAIKDALRVYLVAAFKTKRLDAVLIKAKLQENESVVRTLRKNSFTPKMFHGPVILETASA